MSEAFNANVLSRLKKIDIDEPADLIRYLPYRYDDFTKPLKSVSALRSLGHGQSFYATLRLVSVKSHEELNREKAAQGAPLKSHSGVPYVRVEISDGISKMSSIVFGRVDPWLTAKKTDLNKLIHISGKVVHKNGFVNLDGLSLVPKPDQNRIVARYRGRDRVITSDRIGSLTKISLLHYTEQVVDEMLDELGVDESVALHQCRIPFHNLKQLLITLHTPRTQDDLTKALQAARRINAYYGIRKAMDATVREPNPLARIPMDRELISQIVKQHPFKPTKDQRQAIWDIVCDLDSDTPMDRLLSADVGNGKTLAYGIPAAYAAMKGKNTVIMLPTEPLAGQVAKNIQSWYPQIKVHLATAGFKASVAQGDILVGTTALLSWLKKNPDWKPDFAVVDEQQKMGTAQRDALNAMHTHVLEATATPIPRTMAQTIFGNKKVSLIKDCPVEKDIRTHLIGNTRDEKLFAYNTLSAALEKGGKAIVIYPLVAEQQAYYYHINTDDQKKAEKIAAQIKKSGLSLKWVKACHEQELQDILQEFDNIVETGFIAEFHGEELDFQRLSRRFSRYVMENESDLTYLGSRVDAEMESRNRKTIIHNKELWEKKRPGRVGMIHGRSKREEKAAIIDDMNNGKYDLLVSTTLIEIGVDVKDSRSLLVVNAELLGSYTLHQLRGRLARNGGEADFVMMASCPLEELEEAARARLDLLVKYKNGDDIALNDMEQRGFGNLAAGGKAQKGFEDGIFPSIKLSPSELEGFLRQLTTELQRESSENAISP